MFEISVFQLRVPTACPTKIPKITKIIQSLFVIFVNLVIFVLRRGSPVRL